MKTIDIRGVIGWDVTAEGIRDQLKEAKGEDVEFIINSGGGFVSAGLDIFNQIKNYAGRTKASISSYAMSMGSFIPLAADEIVAEPASVFMIHNVRGFVGGDHNEILKAGNYMKGLSGILAARYVKRTGKSLAEITEMMDNETFMFGQEMVDAGFVDSLIDSDSDDSADAAASLAIAQAAFEEVEARMAQDPAAIKADQLQAAAMLAEIPIHKPIPAVAGKPKEEQQMTLAEFLSANPPAKAEHDAMLSTAKAAGEASVKDIVAKAVPFLSSAAYPDAIKAMAIKTLVGEATSSDLTCTVAAFDAFKQDAAGQTAAAVTTSLPDTPGAQTPAAKADAADGVISDEAGMVAELAKYKEA